MKKMTILVATLLVFAVSSCNFPFAGGSDDALATSVAQTVEAMEKEVQQPTLPIPAATLAPVVVPTAMPVSTVTVVPTEEPDPCLFATFVSETIPDGTKLSPGENFTKTWTIRNDGTCDWNTDYDLVFKSGDHMGGPDTVKFHKEVDPGEKITLSVDLKAPSDEGTYTGVWWFQTHKGQKFGSNGISVKIVVE